MCIYIIAYKYIYIHTAIHIHIYIHTLIYIMTLIHILVSVSIYGLRLHPSFQHRWSRNPTDGHETLMLSNT